ncbi:MAG: hypothetical protein WA081_04140 [Desulfosalsimonadaceae bacterium]
MKKWLIAGVIGFVLTLLPGAWLCADIIILKSGQVIKDVTIKEEGDTLICETSAQSFYIHKSTVENIIRTGRKPISERAEEFIHTLPGRMKLLVRDYFPFAAAFAGLLIILLGLLVFKSLWINIRPVAAGGVKRRQLIKDVKNLDTHEKSVLRNVHELSYATSRIY